jgi:hypothetical protein
MSNRLNWIQQELDQLKEAGFYNRIRTLSSPQGPWLVVDGKRVLNFCSNNYLGLANHPRMVQAAQQASKAAGLDRLPSAPSPERWTCTWNWNAGWRSLRALKQPSLFNLAFRPIWRQFQPW